MATLISIGVGFATSGLYRGQTVPDFLSFWTAARETAAGHAAALYDWPSLQRAMQAGLGHRVYGFIPWKYPPTALLVVWPLAALPLSAAHLVWACGTFAAFACVVYRIAGFNAVLVAIIAPSTASYLLMGQNCFIISALIGASLLASRQSPFAAGLIAGLVSWKPQLFLLLPVIMLMRGGWRALAGLSVSATALACVSVLCLGWAPWLAFLASVRANTESFNGQEIAWWVVQSLFALLRAAGLGGRVAMAAQIVLAMLVLLAVWRIERSGAPAGLRNAAICAAIALATPVILIWDLAILGMGLAFFAAVAVADRPTLFEWAAGAWIVLSFEVFLSAHLQIGFLDGVLLLLLAWRRAYAAGSRQAARPTGASLQAMPARRP